MVKNKRKKPNKKESLNEKMDAKKPKSFLTEYAIILLVIIVFFATWSKFRTLEKKEMYTYDEGVYMQLGSQLLRNPTHYSTIEYYNYKKAHNQIAPEYLNAPLFMHPPLFPFLISLSYRIFGETTRAAELVTFFLSILTIVAVYYIGRYAFDDERRGLLAALLLAVDPVFWLCSKKIWIEIAYTFFIYLGILLLILAIKKNGKLFLYSGISLGLSMVSKHFAAMPCFGIFVFVIFILEDIPSRKQIMSFLLAPMGVLLPWFLWNYEVYGKGSLVANYIARRTDQSEITDPHLKMLVNYALIAAYGFLFGILVAFGRVFFDNSLRGIKNAIKHIIEHKAFKWGISIFSAIICFLIIDSIFHLERFRLDYMPEIPQFMGIFNDRSKIFYIDRLTELFPLYYLGVLSLLFVKRWNKYNVLLTLTILPSFVFFGFFYFKECRYVIAVIPGLVLVSADTILRLYDLLRESPNKILGSLRFLVPLVVIYFIIKILRFDFAFLMNDIVWFLL